MLEAIILLLIGFAILIKASDIFVDAISSIAAHFKMSKMLIALTVAAFGTCAPELAISFNSIMSGQGDIALSNVLGSNVVNILLIIGIAACVSPIKVKGATVKKELPIILLITSIFSLSIVTHYIDTSNMLILSRIDGLLFIVFFAVFLFYIISVVKIKEGFLEKNNPKYKMKTSIVLSIICCILIIFASDLVVDNAKTIAQLFNVSTKIITMTVVVIGTSLPELTMTVISAKKGEYDIAIGNIIGTNIFNIGIVLGLPLLIFGGFQSGSFNLIDVFVVHIAVTLLYFFAKNDKVLSRKEGIIMISTFIIYYAYLLIF